MSWDLRRYLDCAATTPVALEVQAEIQRVEREAWANPSSLHHFGLAAAEQLERSREQIAGLFGCSGQVVFTSGGTESIHLALLGSAADIADQQRSMPRLLVSAVEHPASEAAAHQLQRLGWKVERIPVDRRGLIDIRALRSLLTRPTQLVSLIWGQSEVGALQPIQEIGALCRSAGVLLHVDAVQVAAQRPIAFDALPIDLMSVGSHKLSGPRGIGALLVRGGVHLQAIHAGGGQERGLRSGTEPVALIAGFAAALERLHAQRFRGDGDHMPVLRNRLLSALLQQPGLQLTGPDPRLDSEQRLANHISLIVRTQDGRPLSSRAVVRALARTGYAISSGSACSSRRSAGSSVLEAMGFTAPDSASGIRLSLGDWHTDTVLQDVPEALRRAITAVAAA